MKCEWCGRRIHSDEEWQVIDDMDTLMHVKCIAIFEEYCIEQDAKDGR